MNLQEASAAFQAQLEADGRSPHTRKQYRRHAAAPGRWLARTRRSTDLAQLDHRDLAAFVASPEARCRPDGVDKKATSTNALRTSLRTLFAYLADSGLLPSNPAGLLRRARCCPPPPRSLSGDEQQRLLQVLDADHSVQGRRDRMLVRLLLLAGARIGSALALDVADVDLQSGQAMLRRAKNDAPAILVLSPTLVVDLGKFICDRRDGPLFMTASGARVSVRHIQRRFAALLTAAKITRKTSLHSLRHSFAMTLLERTRNIALVQRALTHRSIASTMAYAKASTAEVRRALVGPEDASAAGSDACAT